MLPVESRQGSKNELKDGHTSSIAAVVVVVIVVGSSIAAIVVVIVVGSAAAIIVVIVVVVCTRAQTAVNHKQCFLHHISGSADAGQRRTQHHSGNMQEHDSSISSMGRGTHCLRRHCCCYCCCCFRHLRCCLQWQHTSRSDSKEQQRGPFTTEKRCF